MNKLPDLSHSREFNKLQRDGIRDFIQAICPNRWNVFEDFKNYKPQKGILNIHLQILDYENERDHRFQGIIHAGMNYQKGIGKSHFILQPSCLSKKRLENLIFHELAHIGIQRWITYKRKVHLKEFGYSLDFPEDNHKYDRHGSMRFRQMVKMFRQRAKEISDERR